MGSSTLLTTSSSTFWGLTSSLSLDILLGVSICVLLFFYGLRTSKGRLIALIFALYTALLVYTNFPYLDAILLAEGTATGNLFSKALVFFGFTLLAFLLLKQFVSAHFPEEGAQRFLQAAILAASATALLLAFSYHVLPVTEVYSLERIEQYFAHEQWFFWWLVAPLAGILIVMRRG